MRFSTLSAAVLIFLAGLSASVLASTEIVVVEATGSGSDRESAVNAALIEALSQVEGVEIVSERTRSSSARELMVRGADGRESQITLNRSSQEAVRTATEGFVDGFEVLRVRDLGGQIEVRLEARIATFKAPGAERHTTRRRIAIYPVEARGAHTFLGQRYGGQELGERLTQSLVEAMTGTRRFAVLERSRDNAIEAELAFLTDPTVARKEAARIGQAVGADYVLNAQLVDFDVSTQRRTSQLTGEVSTRIAGAVAVEMRIVSTATRQIMWADTEVIQGESLTDPSVQFQSAAGALTEMLGLVAQRLTRRAVDAIYPMRIVSISADGNVVVNQGSNRLARGDVLDVYLLGKHLEDPYSGESLGREETQVGSIEVTRVTSKVGYAVSAESESWLSDARESDFDYVVRETGERRSDQPEIEQGEAPPVLLPQDL